MPQVGHCCISLAPDNSNREGCANASMTVAHVSKLEGRERVAYIHRAVLQNLTALSNTVDWLITLPPALRMFRITSGLLPLYTHAVAQPVYAQPAFARQIADSLAATGSKARAHGVRLSLHPGQFTVLNSTGDATRIASVAEFEYHARIGEMLGFNGGNRLSGRNNLPLDSFVINIHGGSWQGSFEASTEGWRDSWPRLSSAARRMITLENDEMSWGAPEIVQLCEALDVRAVLDVHHNWVRTSSWLNPFDALCQRALQTWAGLAPKLHVSLPDPDLIMPRMGSGLIWDDDPAVALDDPFGFESLPIALPGVSKSALRTHSNYLYHPATVPYLHTWGNAGWSIMAECKAKNLASHALYACLQWQVFSHRHDLLDAPADPLSLTKSVRSG